MIQRPSHFLKNISRNLPDAAKLEVRGLELLRKYLENNDISIPKVYKVDDSQIRLEYLEPIDPTPAISRKFGEDLAKFHSVHSKSCGLEYDNYIGASVQRNILSDDWGEFFVEYGIKQQLSFLQDKSLKEKLGLPWNALVPFLNENCRGFSLLHGDLWSGNYIYTKNKTYLFDPAVYWGDSEADLAMTFLFGGFPKDFYEGYRSLRPFSQYFEIKRTIYNYYHLLNHLNLFGRGYLEQLGRAKEFILHSI